MYILNKLSLGIIAVSTLAIFATPANCDQSESLVKSDTSSSKLSNKKMPASGKSFRGVSFRNANKIEFKYKERIKNFKEQLEMGIKKGWLTDQEVVEFKEKISVLEKLEAKVSGKNYPKLELDQMEKMFTLYNQEFYKASNTPMSKKKSLKKTKTTKNKAKSSTKKTVKKESKTK